jgi:hypothetical protein
VAYRKRRRPRLCDGGSPLLTTASGTSPNCKLRGRGLQWALNVASSGLRRKDAATVYITINAPSKSSGVSISATCCEASKHVAAYGRIAQIPLKNSEIGVSPKSRLPANIVAFTGSCRCKAYQRVARRKTGRFAEAPKDFHRGRQRFSEL